MAPLIPVKSLFDLCTDVVVQWLHNYSLCHEINKDVNESFRLYLLGLLPGTIREHLIYKSLLKQATNNVNKVAIVHLLMDPSVKKLCLYDLQNPGRTFVSREQLKELFSRITPAAISGLHELHVKPHRVCPNAPPLKIQLDLSPCLAVNLKVLTLHTIANDEILSILGQYAQHLTILDISSSWGVSDVGIHQLLLKNSADINLEQSDAQDTDSMIVQMINRYSTSEKNRICDTLCEFKMQETNTTPVSLIYLILFVRNLKSLGGFLYYKNIGDAVIRARMCSGCPKTLPLTELWDSQLPIRKLVKICVILPQLSSLYTRAGCLPPVPNVVPPLKNLSVDFDFHYHSEQFSRFLQFNGASLTRLTLIDQISGIDMVELVQYCPQLERFFGKVCVSSTEHIHGALSQLKEAKLKITSATTFHWVMQHADNIETLQILFERSRNRRQPVLEIEENLIQNIIDKNYKSLQSIQSLSLALNWDPVTRTDINGKLTINAAYALLSACNNLTLLGDLETWCDITQNEVVEMAKHIQKFNWNVQMRYQKVLYPARDSDVIQYKF